MMVMMMKMVMIDEDVYDDDKHGNDGDDINGGGDEG